MSQEPVFETEGSDAFNSAMSEGVAAVQHQTLSTSNVAASASTPSAPKTSSSSNTHAPVPGAGPDMGATPHQAPGEYNEEGAAIRTGSHDDGNLSPTSGGGGVSGTGGVRHTDYLGNFIRDPALRRAAVEEIAARQSSDTSNPAAPLAQTAGRQPSAGPAPQPAASANGTFSGATFTVPYPIPVSVMREETATGVLMPQIIAAPPRPITQPNGPGPSATHTATLGTSSRTPQSSNTMTRQQVRVSSSPMVTTQPSTSVNRSTRYPAGGSTVVVDNNGYINVDDIPVRLSTMGRRDRPWHYGVCHCCSDCDACLESWCCMPCQVSRQCNVLTKNDASVHWPFCLFITFTEVCTACSLVACLFVGQSRRMARERYGIAGSGIGDCCCAFWCRCCTLEQVLLEMQIMNDSPGGCCLTEKPAPSGPHGDCEMR